MDVPEIICSLASLTALVSIAILYVCALRLVCSTWKGHARDRVSVTEQLLSMSRELRGTVLLFILVIILMASDNFNVLGYSRLYTSGLLCACYAVASIPAFVAVVLSDLVSIFRQQTNTDLASLRGNMRLYAFNNVLLGLVLAWVLAG